MSPFPVIGQFSSSWAEGISKKVDVSFADQLALICKYRGGKIGGTRCCIC